MHQSSSLHNFFIQVHPVHQVVNFDPQFEKLIKMDFTASNPTMQTKVLMDTPSFCTWVNGEVIDKGYKFGIGGYNELRTVYDRSPVFDGQEGEPRRLHLGLDIWGAEATPVFAVMDGIVHSFAFNNAMGDYGATIILKHEMEGRYFHSLYGHLSRADLTGLEKGQLIEGGSLLAHFGALEENGFWPPHLHFQLIVDMEGMEGDYPGVCRFSEREKYLANCPNPNLLLNLEQFI